MQAQALIHQPDGGQWFALEDPVAVLAARDPADVPELLVEVEAQARQQRCYALGFLTYEAAAGVEPALATHAPGLLPPAWFALFSSRCPAEPPAAAPIQPPLHWQPDTDHTGYRQAIQQIHDYIAAGDTYQVNFTYRLHAAMQQTPPLALFADMIRRQPGGYGTFLETPDWAICSASPELLFTRRGRRLTSRPMKGTAPRGDGAAQDRHLARQLERCPKNRAENLMITDMVRNDIGRLADTGSVRTEALFHLEPHPTVWQLTSTVHGDTDADLAEIMAALFPAASITGAPKRRTMQIIRELEATPREIYTGTLGLLAPDGTAQFNVAIRTALVDKRRQRAEYGVGGGILWDSRADEEFAETRTKARILAGHTRSGRTPNRRSPAGRGAGGGAAGGDTVAGDFQLLETLLWEPGAGYFLLAGHLDRLAGAAAHFCRPADRHGVLQALETASRSFSACPHRVRLLVDSRGTPSAEAAPLTAPPPQRVALVPADRPLRTDPWVRHKTTRRDVYDAARCLRPDADDVLLVNESGEVTEATIANLVADLNGKLVTPPLESGLLPGIYRRHLLETGQVMEQVLTEADLRRSRRLYLINSVRGMWPVTLL